MKWLAILFALCMLAPLSGTERWSSRLFAKRTFRLTDPSAGYLGVIFFSRLAVRTER